MCLRVNNSGLKQQDSAVDVSVQRIGHSRISSNLVQLLRLGISGVAVSMVAFVIWTSRLLRPIADDYGIAVAANAGLIGSITGFWQSWSGAVTSTLSLTLFVGLPLRHLPWSVASAIPFLSSAILMAAVGIWLLAPLLPEQNRGDKAGTYLVSFAALLATWWGYWWLPAHLNPGESTDFAIALGATHWQSVLAGYVIPMSPLVWAWLYLWTKRVSNLGLSTVIHFSLGLLAGFGSAVFAASSVVMILALGLLTVVRRGPLLRSQGFSLISTTVGVVIGALASHFSPGSQYRASLFSGPEDSPNVLLLLIPEALSSGVSDWVDAISRPAAFMVVVVIGGTTFALSQGQQSLGVRPLLGISVGLLGFSLVSFIVNRASELFVYEAFWHLTGPRAIAWIGLIALAVALGNYLSRFKQSALSTLAIVLSTFIGLYFLIASLDFMCRQIIDRSEPWELGPAPVYDISDIDDPHGWVLTSWLELRELRDAPERKLP